MRRRQDNRGSALIVVIIVVAFASLLVATLFMMTVINIQMKSVDREAKENFYSAEGALEQITLGLQKELSETSADAYALVMQQYAGNTLEVQRREIFNDKLLADLKSRLENSGTVGKYDISVLQGYLTAEVATHTVVNSTKDRQLVLDNDSLVLKGVEVSYTDDQGLLTVIETDIRMTAPNLNLIQPSDMPDVFDYSIVANQKLVGNLSGTVEIGASVYAGEDGLDLSNGAVWDFKQANRVIVQGAVNVPGEASLSTTNDMDLWVKELNVSGGTLASRGRTYVSNDLIMSGAGSTVTLEGEYYGYGNGEMLTEAGIMLSAGGDSSAILINGVNSTLDMSNMRRLLLSGSAQIATGQLAFDEDEFTNILPENEPSLDTEKKAASLSSASYYMVSMGNGKLVCSDNNYLIAQTASDYPVVQGSWERLVLVNNSDGTVSFMDPNNHAYKYVTVKTEDQNMMVATADSIGINEKFYLYVITQGNTNFYALKSYANGKFVSIDTYYPAEGGSVEAVLCANRDKITDDAQLFLIKHWGAYSAALEQAAVEPIISITYDSANQATIRFGHGKWLNRINANGNAEDPVPANHGSYLRYTVYRGNEVVKVYPGEDATSGEQMDFYMNDDNPKKRWSLYKTITDLKDGDVIEYTIDYVGDYASGSKSGTYVHQAGYGNNPEAELKLVDGVYAIHQAGESVYCQVTDYGNKLMKFSVGSAVKNDSSWELFHLVNNHDGSISLKAHINKKYICIQEDGTLVANSNTIDANTKFYLRYGENDGVGYYQLWSGADSIVGVRCFAADMEQANQGRPVYMMAADEVEKGESEMIFEWMRVTGEMGTQPEPVIPPEPVNYNPVTSVVYADEDKATASFSSPYWTEGNTGTVKLIYSIGLSPTYPEIEMTVSGTTATCTIPNLQHLDKVIYRFEYTYKDTSGMTHTVTTPNYIYVHERKYGDAINVQGENVDINLGESIEVKSNQIAYLVPPDCIGVNNGNVLIGKNPMSAADFTQLMVYANDTAKYPDFEIVSFTKEVEGLGKTLDTYRTEGTDGYRTIFVQSAEGTMVYFYVDFDSDNTSAYFRDYYEKNQSTLQSYMKNYVNEIRLSNRFTRLTTNGNMVYSPNGSTGRIDLRSNEGYGANPDAVALSGLRNEEAGYQKRFKALSTKLMMDYDELTTTEKTRNLFDNLIRYSEVAGDPEGQAFAGIAPNTTPLSYTVDNATALVVHNKGLGAYHYNAAADPGNEVCLILATGDVVVEKDFSGIIIARGTVTVQNSSVNKIESNQQALYKVLKYQMDPDNPNSDTFLEYYFRDGDKYILDDGTETVVTDGDYVSYADLVTYEEWTKR